MKKSIFNAVCKTRYLALLVLLIFTCGNALGETIEFKIKGSGASGSAYIDTETAQTAASTYGYKINHWNPSSGQVKGNQSTIANNFYIYNTTPIPGSITGIQIVTLSGTYDFTKAYYMLGTSQCTTASGGTAFSSNSVSGLSGSNTYFRVQFMRYTTSGTCTADKIIITYTPTPSCTAPNHVDISGNWDRFGGETISLTATAYSSAGTGSPIADGNITGWQWQKWNGSTWVNVTNGTSAGATTSGATTKNLQITNCGGGNSGSYRCTVSTGATCSTSSDGFQVKVYVLECYTGGTTVYNFTRDGANQRGSVTVSFSCNTDKVFKVRADNDYYGNNGTVSTNVTNWVWNEGNNCTVKAGYGGDVTFTMDYSTGGNNSTLGIPEVSVTYNDNKTIYVAPGSYTSDNAKIAIYYWSDGGNGWTGFLSSTDCSNGKLVASLPVWTQQFSVVRLSSSCTSPNWSDKWNQTNDINISCSNDQYSFSSWCSGDNCKETFTPGTYSPTTYTISFAGNGNTGGSMSDITGINCGTDQALTANAFTKTGYNFDGWKADVDVKINGSTVSAGTKFNGGVTLQDIRGDIALTAQWLAKSCAVTFDKNGGTGGSDGTTATYGSAMTTITPPTRAGYTFDGYWDAETENDGSGNKYYNANGTSAANWNKDTESATTLYAKWVAKTDTYKTGLHTGASGWTSYASGVTKNGAGYTIPNPGSVAKGGGSGCEDTHYHFAGWVADEYKGSPSGHIIAASGTTDATGATYWAVWEKEGAGGASLTKLTSSYEPQEGDNLVIVAKGTSYALYQETTNTSYVNKWSFANSAATVGSDDKNYITLESDGDGDWYLGDETNGYIYTSGSNNLEVNKSGSKTAFTFGTEVVDAVTYFTFTSGRWLSYRSDLGTPNYRLGGTNAKASGASGNALFDLYKYVGVSFEDPKAVCEACVATPSISGVSLAGSTFSTTSVPVQATGASAGENCSLAEYGFYWGGSANPTTNETASDNLSTGTFSATLTGPFVIGTTYHYRAYGTNEADITGYSSDATFTLHNVTFNMHDHGDAKAAQVVPEGGKVTNPGDPSEAGWTFGGWWANSTFSGSAWDFSTNTVGSGDLVLHAKWTEKPKYTITLNAGNGTISDANWTNTSGSTYTRTQANGDEEITLPTPSCNCAGWVFQGWSTTSKDNAASFTPDKEDGASFVPAANVMYYAVYRANATGGTTYNKITSTGDLTTGNYIFMSSTGYAMKNVVTSSQMDEVGGYTASNSSQTIDNANLVWTIAKFSSQVVIKNGANYLGIDANNNICLTTTPHFFTYTYNGTNSRWEFTSATKTSYQLVYSSYFKVLTSQSTAIYLYKQGAGLTGNYYTNPDCSDISVTGVVSPEGSGTVTLTASSGKTGDKVYAMYTPDDDYNFDEWTISGTGSTLGSTTAVVTEITIGSANTTVTANFVAKDWKSITWKANGVALTGGDLGSASVKVENGFDITALPPTPTSCDGTSTTFMGWVEESDVWSGKTNDVSGVTIYEDVSDFPTVTDDVTYHAVWAKRNGSAAPATYAGTGVFTKITTLEELEVGAHYVLYGMKDDDNTVKGAMNNTFTNEAAGKNVFGASSVTISDNKITNPAATVVWKLGGTTDAYTLYSQNSSKYVEITANDSRGYTNPSSATTSFTISVSEGNFKIVSNGASAGSRMISIYTASVFRSYSYLTEGYTLNLYKYGSNYTYDQYLVKCCEDPELAFGGEYNYQTLVRQDIHGAHGDNGSATVEQGKATLVLDYATESGGTCTVEVKKLTGGDNRSTAVAGSSCANHTGIAINESTKKVTFDVWTYAGSYPTANGQGTYRIKITQEATSTYCAAETYYFVDVILRDKFVDAVNGNATINVDGQSKSTTDFYKTPTEASLDGDKNDDCHSTTRRFLGWVREDNMDTWYGSSSDRTRDLDDKKDDAALVAPNADIITTGSTWYAVWGFEE